MSEEALIAARLHEEAGHYGEPQHCGPCPINARRALAALSTAGFVVLSPEQVEAVRAEVRAARALRAAWLDQEADATVLGSLCAALHARIASLPPQLRPGSSE